MPASQAVAGTAVTVEVSAMHRKNHRNKNIYQQVKIVNKVVDFLVSQH